MKTKALVLATVGTALCALDRHNQNRAETQLVYLNRVCSDATEQRNLSPGDDHLPMVLRTEKSAFEEIRLEAQCMLERRKLYISSLPVARLLLIPFIDAREAMHDVFYRLGVHADADYHDSFIDFANKHW